MVRAKIAVGIAILAIVSATGCAGPQPVAPWEKGNLAKPHMALDPDPLDSRIKRQVYLSKEAASGGNAIGGSACGCN